MKNKNTALMLKFTFITIFIFLSGLFGISKAYAETFLSPDSGYWGETIGISGGGFGSFENDETNYVQMTNSDGESIIAKIQFPQNENWNEDIVYFTVPTDTPNTSYTVTLHTSSGSQEVGSFIVIDYYTPTNFKGTPDFTADYIISNTQSINVSDAIRQISQSMLLPSKDTIVDLGRYINEAIVFRLDIGDSQSDSKNDLQSAWEFSRNISNAFVIILLVITGVMIMFRSSRLTTYSIKSLIPKVIIAPVLANFSFFIVRIITDFTLVITYIILDQIAIPAGQSLAVPLLGELRMNLFVVFMLGFYLLIGILLALVIILLLFRIVAIWFMVVIGPPIFLLMILPGNLGLPLKWLKTIGKLLIIGPFIALLLFIGVTLSRSAETAFGNTDILRAMSGTATLILILFTPQLLSSLGNLSKKVFSTTVLKSSSSKESLKEKTTEKEHISSIEMKKRLGLDDSESNKINTISIAKTANAKTAMDQIMNGETKESELQKKLKALKQKQTPNSTGSMQASEPKSSNEAYSGSASISSSEMKTNTENQGSFDLSDSARASRIADSFSAPRHQEPKNLAELFFTAPANLLKGWLSDKSKHKTIEDAIVLKNGNIEIEKAQIIYQSTSGKVLLSDLSQSQSKETKDATANLIEKVILDKPNELTNTAKSALQTGPIGDASTVLLQTGVSKLGASLNENPDNADILSSAKNLIMEGSQSISKALNGNDQNATDFVTRGTQSAAEELGSTAIELTNNATIESIESGNSPEKETLHNVTEVASNTLGEEKIPMTTFGNTPEEQVFVASAYVSNDPATQKVTERFDKTLNQEPQNPNLRKIAANIVKLTPDDKLSSLPSAITEAASNFALSDEFDKHPDQGLLSSLLSTLNPDEMLAHQKVSPDMLKNSTPENLTQNAPVTLSSKTKEELPLRHELVSTDFSPKSLGKIDEQIGVIKEKSPELVQESAVALASSKEDLTSLGHNTTREALKAFEGKNLEATLKEDSLKTFSRNVLNNSKPNDLDVVSNKPKVLSGLTASALGTIDTIDMIAELPHTDDGEKLAEELVKKLISKGGILESLSQKESLDLMQSIPIEKINSSLPASEGTNNFLQKSLSGANKTGLDPETAAKALLLTENKDISEVPWDLIKQAMTYMVKLDRQSPLYAKLNDKVSLHPKSEYERGKMLSEGIEAGTKGAIPEALKKLESTPLSSIGKLPKDEASTLLKSLGELPKESVTPDLAAKAIQTLPPDVLENVPSHLRKKASKYISDKPADKRSKEDNALAASIVAATPTESLAQLSQSIMSLASSISGNISSNQNRESIQAGVRSELSAQTTSNEPEKEPISSDPNTSHATREEVKF